jgi:kynurenine formamidase
MKAAKQIEFTIRAGAGKIIDLSYPIQAGMTLMQPIYGELEYTIHEVSGKKNTAEVDETGYPLMGYFSRLVKSHANGLHEGYGTHVEASSHAFGNRGLTIDKYPIEAFMGPGVVIDISTQSEKNPEYKATVDDLLAWENKHNKIPKGAIVILNTGRYKYWGNYNRYFGVDEKGKFHYPGIKPDACEMLVNRSVSAVGTDAATIDGNPIIPVPDYPKGRLSHGLARETLMKPGNDILNIEYLANVDKLPEFGSFIFCAPINFVGGSGGTARIFVILP